MTEPSIFDLSNRRVVVTGANRGLGREIAETCARCGADVAVNYPDEAVEREADAVREACEAAGVRATTVEADVTDPAAVDRLFEAVTASLGRPNALVNNAGVGASVPIADLDEETWDRVLDVDLSGVYRCARAAVECFEGDDADETGRIVNVASQLAFKGATEMAHYCAAKGGVVSFTRALAREVAPAVTVNAVAPGPMTTEMLLDGTSEAWREGKRAEIPLGRFADPAEVAPSVAFLVSEAGAYYTGQVLSPDGGDAMH